MSARIAVLVAALVATSSARAHTVAVDGNPAEWSTRVPATSNVAMVVRRPGGAGEFVWSDALGDYRTDLIYPHSEDLGSVRITGDAAGLYFLVPMPSNAGTTEIQLQIAIDLDRVAGSGEAALRLAETSVADGARWERLLVTRFASVSAPLLLDTAWTAVPGGAQFGGGSNQSELGVTWAALGLGGPPSTPIRFTFAVFRSTVGDEPVELPGSDALDVVSNYGDPGLLLNTWGEVSDGVIDHSFDVWFDALGEVYAPLLVDRFAPNTGASADGEWYVVRNATSFPLALEAFKLGGEEAPDGGEAMHAFPPGTTLAPGATFTVAVSGATFLSAFGRRPDGELLATDPLVPDLVPFTPWGSGTPGLFNLGGELLVLDPSNTISDFVAYGVNSYPGFVYFNPAPALNEVLVRRGTVDTDTMSADFLNAGAQCASDAQCGQCRACVLGACEAAPSGGTCDLDSNLCTQDACVAGTCNAGPMLTCADGKVCTIDSCVPATGLCQFSAKADATPCPDADLCDGTEICSAGDCVENTPLVCSDSNLCTADSCVPATGCVYTPTPGVACDLDGSLCTADTCRVDGTCGAGGPLACDDGRECTDDFCNPATGCVYMSDDVNECSDGSACTSGDACSSGNCVGTPLTCADANPCTADSCDPGSGCVHANLAAGTPCLDGDLCNGAESCSGGGACLAGTPLTCDDSSACTGDSCDAATGCVFTALTGSSCADADLCNGDEACSAAGTCAPGTPPVCDDANACTAESCDPASGCANTPVPCDDGSACTTDSCDPASGCASTPVSCDDGNACTADSCDAVTGCASVNATDGTPCAEAGCALGASCQAGSCTCTAEPPTPEPSDPGGCSCGGGADGGATLLALLSPALLVPARRRRDGGQRAST